MGQASRRNVLAFGMGAGLAGLAVPVLVAAFGNPDELPPNPFMPSLASGPVAGQTKGGMRQITGRDKVEAPATAAALSVLRPGGSRAMPWHPNADGWHYSIKGSEPVTIFNTGPSAVSHHFGPGEVGYIKRNFARHIKNPGDTDLVFMEIFRADFYPNVSLQGWAYAWTAGAPIEVPFNLTAQDLAGFPNNNPDVMPL